MEKEKELEKDIKGENLTGYPHIDKPWMKFYDKEKLVGEDPKMNVTDYIKYRNVGREDNVSTSYYGKEITYGEMYERQDNASKVFTELGMKKNDRIMFFVPTIPESGEMFLGATQIGVTSDFVDPRPDSMDLKANAQKILEIIKYEKANYIVAFDQAYLAMLKPIENELKEIGIDKIITVSAADSMNFKGTLSYFKDVINYNSILNAKTRDEEIKKLKWYQAMLNKFKFMQEMKEKYNEAIKTSPLEILPYKDLLRDCRYSSFKSVYDENLIHYIGHTSGTSGTRPKPIPITNENAISTLEQIRKGDLAVQPGDKVIQALPFFAAFGTYNDFLSNLASGSINIQVPEFDITEFAYLIKKYHPNCVVANPAWLSKLPDCEYLKNEDLSCLTTIIYGGDAMSEEDEERLNKWLKEHGSSCVVSKGHGMSEICGVGSYANKNFNKLKSIGIPMPETIYTIIDPNNEKELVPLKFEDGKDRLYGELVISGKNVTKGILDGNVITPHYQMDGLDCIRTRDLVEMDRDGIFYHIDRKDRSFNRFDGYKIIPAEIENIIEKNSKVRYAKLVPYYSEFHKGTMPICHIVLEDPNVTKEEELEIVKDIIYNQIIANPKMSSRQIPTKFKFRTEFPLNKMSKIDFVSLSKEGLNGDEINVDIRETNMAVEDINIYINSKDKSKVLKK